MSTTPAQKTAPATGAPNPIDEISALIRSEQQSLVSDRHGARKAGFLCNYTPQEVLAAAGVRHARIFKGGDASRAAAGELFTQSVFCDFTKSCIGGFEQGDPLYKAFDKVYNFHTCATMKRATEVIENYVPVRLLNLPKLRKNPDSRAFFREEILRFRDDLAQLTGSPPVGDDALLEQIRLHNAVRRELRAISALRKRPHPPLTGGEFVDIVRAFYYVEPAKLLPCLQRLHAHYAARPAPANLAPPIRLQVAGSIIADGDRRILDIAENELGTRVVVEDHCAGVRPFCHTIPEDGDPWLALANGYLDQSPCARQRPLGDAVDFSAGLADEYKVDGVLYVFLKFCACYGVPQRDFIQRHQAAGRPVLVLSSDYSESDRGQLLTRMEAFIDVIREGKAAPGPPPSLPASLGSAAL